VGTPVIVGDPEVAWDALKMRLTEGRPSLLPVDDGEHWVAAVGLLGDSVLVADSADPELVVPYTQAALTRRWKTGDPPQYWAMDVRRAPRRRRG
jgi:hypothetical protein